MPRDGHTKKEQSMRRERDAVGETRPHKEGQGIQNGGCKRNRVHKRNKVCKRSKVNRKGAGYTKRVENAKRSRVCQGGGGTE